MKLLLTGSTGFVGRNLLLELLQQKKYETIYLPVRSESKLKDQLQKEGISELPREVNLLKMEAPHWDFSELKEVDHVVHSAGVLSGNSLEDYSQTNTEGTLRLMRTLKSPSKIVVLSSQAASGPCADNQKCKTEADPDSPVTWYGTSKLEMENQVEKEFSGQRFVFLRPTMILGPRDSATLPLFKMAGGAIQFKPGFQTKYYSFVAVQDLVHAILRVLENPVDLRTLNQRKFFVASDKVISDTELITTAVEVMNRPARLLKIPQPVIWGISQVVGNVPALSKAIPNLSKDRAKEIWPDKWVVSARSFEETFDWKATTKLKSSLTETFEWYKRTGQLT